MADTPPGNGEGLEPDDANPEGQDLPGEFEGFAMPEPAPRGRRATMLGFLLDAFRRRRSGRYVLNGMVSLLFVSGAGMFAYPFFTDVYTEQILQRGLDREFAQIQVSSYEEWEAQVAGDTGTPLTKIVIPRLEVETLVVEGTSPAALRAGAGHYPTTPLPGQDGNVAIAGHRTTYGRPFNRLDELDPGDEVWLITPIGDYRYVLSRDPFVTTPKDWSVIEPTATPSVTLTTCHPKGSARERLIVRAELTDRFPAGHYDGQVSAAGRGAP